MYILVIGNPIIGFQFVGPFDNEALAEEYGDIVYASTEWWVAPVDVRKAKVIHTDFNGPAGVGEQAKCACGHYWAEHTQNVHRVLVCTQCNCRGMQAPSENPN